MGIYQHLSHFAGMKVTPFAQAEDLKTPSSHAFFVGAAIEYGEAENSFGDLFLELLSHPAVGRVQALVIGAWDGACEGTSSAATIEMLVGAREKLAGLRALFLGDILQEEFEISWIVQSDVTPLLHAYPALEELQVRGGTSLRFGRLKHPALKKLAIQAGGLGGDVVRDIGSSELPQLEHLELWLGTENYGGNATAKDLERILSGAALPSLRYLGLRNRHHLDTLLPAIVQAPVLKQLETLDLSMGTLNDKEAAVLLDHAANFKHIEEVNLSENFLSTGMIRKLKQAGVKVISQKQREDDSDEGQDYRYCAVSE